MSTKKNARIEIARITAGGDEHNDQITITVTMTTDANGDASAYTVAIKDAEDWQKPIEVRKLKEAMRQAAVIATLYLYDTNDSIEH